MDAIEILANAANDTKSTAAWLTVMNAIYYLRAGHYGINRARGISEDICDGSKLATRFEVA